MIIVVHNTTLPPSFHCIIASHCIFDCQHCSDRHPSPELKYKNTSTERYKTNSAAGFRTPPLQTRHKMPEIAN